MSERMNLPRQVRGVLVMEDEAGRRVAVKIDSLQVVIESDVHTTIPRGDALLWDGPQTTITYGVALSGVGSRIFVWDAPMPGDEPLGLPSSRSIES